MNPITRDRLDMDAARAIRRVIFVSSVFNGGHSTSSTTRGYWLTHVVSRNVKEAVEACELSDGLTDCCDLLRELGALDRKPIRPSETRHLNGNRQSEIRKALADIIGKRFGIFQQLLVEREEV